MKCLILYVFVVTFLSAVVATLIPQEEFDEKKVQLYLWNKNTVEQSVSVDNYGNITKAPVKFLIHGYLDSGTGEDFFFYGPFVQKYIKTEVNVICVDWSFYSKRIYHDSVLWLRSIADLIARFIVNLKKQKGNRFEDIHLIGHSLGAQMSGFIGKYIQQKNSGAKLGRITGLDPAGPLFRRRPATDRLYKTDATHVDTIIADIYLFGMDETLGQVNFYVWCGGKPELLNLNHLLAPFYYSYGISKSDLIAKQCQCLLTKMIQCKDNPTNILGQNVNFNNPGTYYINLDVAAVMKDSREAMATAPASKIKTSISKIIQAIQNALPKLHQ